MTLFTVIFASVFSPLIIGTELGSKHIRPVIYGISFFKNSKNYFLLKLFVLKFFLKIKKNFLNFLKIGINFLDFFLIKKNFARIFFWKFKNNSFIFLKFENNFLDFF